MLPIGSPGAIAAPNLSSFQAPRSLPPVVAVPLRLRAQEWRGRPCNRGTQHVAERHSADIILNPPLSVLSETRNIVLPQRVTSADDLALHFSIEQCEILPLLCSGPPVAPSNGNPNEFPAAGKAPSQPGVSNPEQPHIRSTTTVGQFPFQPPVSYGPAVLKMFPFKRGADRARGGAERVPNRNFRANSGKGTEVRIFQAK